MPPFFFRIVAALLRIVGVFAAFVFLVAVVVTVTIVGMTTAHVVITIIADNSNAQLTHEHSTRN